MDRMKSLVNSFVKEEDGIAATEYGLLVALVAVVVVALLKGFGTSLTAWWNKNTSAALP